MAGVDVVDVDVVDVDVVDVDVVDVDVVDVDVVDVDVVDVALVMALVNHSGCEPAAMPSRPRHNHQFTAGYALLPLLVHPVER